MGSSELNADYELGDCIMVLLVQVVCWCLRLPGVESSLGKDWCNIVIITKGR